MEGLWDILKKLFELLQKLFGGGGDQGPTAPEEEGYFEDGYLNEGYHKREIKRNG